MERSSAGHAPSCSEPENHGNGTETSPSFMCHCGGNIGFLNVADTLLSTCTCADIHTLIGKC